MNRAPSLKALIEAFPSVDPDKLKLVRKAWRSMERSEVQEIANQHAPTVVEWLRQCHTIPQLRDVRRALVDALIDNHGVEFLGIHRRSGEDVYYSNSGDTYDATLIFHGSNLSIGCWGDLVEKNLIKENQ